MAALKSASGPVAFDAERAHGHRYWPKAYLFQVRRPGAGTWLIDPIAFEQGGPAQLGTLVTACQDATWIIHAASQDLPCMREVGIVPPKLFDTELAARLLGAPATGLAALLADKLGITLRKAHSAANWATRPLPTPWLTYAALDVDYLVELATELETELVARGREDWARQEFAHVLASFTSAQQPKPEPWRRLSGISNLKHPNQLALARELWLERDAIARAKDRPPSWILSDAAIVDLAARLPKQGPMPGAQGLRAVPGFSDRRATRYFSNWVNALSRAASLEAAEYPTKRTSGYALPPTRTWEKLHPAAWQRWKCVRAAMERISTELGIQANLIAPSALLQQLVFQYHPGQDIAAEARRLGLRAWQLELLLPIFNDCQALR